MDLTLLQFDIFPSRNRNVEWATIKFGDEKQSAIFFTVLSLFLKEREREKRLQNFCAKMADSDSSIYDIPAYALF